MIQNVVVAIQHQVSLRQILASTVFGLITKMVHIHQTAIPTVNLINLRYRDIVGTVFWTNGYGQYSGKFFEQFDCRNDRIVES